MDREAAIIQVPSERSVVPPAALHRQLIRMIFLLVVIALAKALPPEGAL